MFFIVLPRFVYSRAQQSEYAKGLETDTIKSRKTNPYNKNGQNFGEEVQIYEDNVVSNDLDWNTTDESEDEENEVEARKRSPKRRSPEKNPVGRELSEKRAKFFEKSKAEEAKEEAEEETEEKAEEKAEEEAEDKAEEKAEEEAEEKAEEEG